MEKNELSATEDFMDGLTTPQEDPFTPNNEDPFAQPEVKEETMEVEVKEEKPVAFHKDPKVQRYIEKEISKRLADFKPSVTEQFVHDVNEENPLVEAFTNIIGNDTPEKVSALKALKNSLENVKEEAAQEAYAKFAKENERAKQQEIEAQEELETEFENIEEHFGVDLSSNAPAARKNRNEFIDFIKRVAPKNADGEIVEYPDLMQTFEVFKDMKKPAPQNNSQTKFLASRSMSRSGETSGQPTRRVSWDNMDSLLGLDK